MKKHNSENLNTSRFTDRDLHVYINGEIGGDIGARYVCLAVDAVVVVVAANIKLT
jgi:hypothetical protein